MRQINDVQEVLSYEWSYSEMVFWFNHLLSLCSGCRLKHYINTNLKYRFLNVKPSLIPVEKLKIYFLQGEFQNAPQRTFNCLGKHRIFCSIDTGEIIYDLNTNFFI